MKSSIKYSIPDGLRVYAIGDVHGHLQTLKEMQEAIAADLAKNLIDRAHIIYMGDYIDRGPDSAGVIQYLCERKSWDDEVKKSFLIGNHEAAMMRFVNSDMPHEHQSWLKWGGRETAVSYGVDVPDGPLTPGDMERIQAGLRKALPKHHVEFMNGLSMTVEEGGYFFVHAGVHPQKPLDQQKIGHLLTIRETFMKWDEPLEKMIVHGHTITKDHKPEVMNYRIGIDTGLYEGGPLTCGVFEGENVRFLSVGGSD